MLFSTILAAASRENQYVLIGLCTFQLLLTVLLILLTRKGKRR